MSPPTDLIGVEETAEALGISTSTARNYGRAGRLHAMRDSGGRWWFRRAQVDDLASMPKVERDRRMRRAADAATATSDLLTPRQAARLLDVDVRTVGNWADAGKLPSVRPNGPAGHRRYPRGPVEAIANEPMQGPPLASMASIGGAL